MRNFCFLLLFLLAGCGKTESFPTTIDVQKDNPVEKVEAFIIQRFTKLEDYARNFELYYNTVINGRSISNAHSLWFESSKYALSEAEKSTKTIVNEFVKSPTGAYLTENDQLYIKRLINEKAFSSGQEY